MITNVETNQMLEQLSVLVGSWDLTRPAVA
jgi:hypothetical protein